MEAIISNLLNRFEKGGLTRRELIQSLAMLAAGGAASVASAAPQAQSPALKGIRIDHISVQVTDMPRSLAFYQGIFGLPLLNEDKANEIVRLGTPRAIVSLHHKAPYAIVDHYAIGVEGFNRESVTRQLATRGITPAENLDFGFHIKDPDGVPVQIVGA
jgi:catechol 2,3-dioxygenase-like lactoylglutathione lyase family enzyme